METRTSKWVWSSILYRWPTLWCSWAPIFSVSSLCLGRKDTFFHFRPTEVHKFSCSHLFKTYFTLNVPRDLLAVVTSCTFSHVSYMFRGQNENFNCVLSFSTFSPLSCSITHEQRLVKSSGQNDQYPFGWRVFSAWDFLITERETADNKLASLTTAIKVGIVYAIISLIPMLIWRESARLGFQFLIDLAY